MAFVIDFRPNSERQFERDYLENMETVIPLPRDAAVLILGSAGSGKSTFARAHFAESQVLSSDRFRAMISDDEGNQGASSAAFDILHRLLDYRLLWGRLSVVDATNLKPSARQPLLDRIRRHGRPAVAIVLDPGLEVCRERNARRTSRVVDAHVLELHQNLIRQALEELPREGFAAVCHLSSAEMIDAVRLEVEAPAYDRRKLAGPFDIIGDVHGCLDELLDLLVKLGYGLSPAFDRYDRPTYEVVPPEGRTLLFVGDLPDRGPDSPGVIRLAMRMAEQGKALAVRGNHDDKLYRKLMGRDVSLGEAIRKTLEQLDGEPPEWVAEARDYLGRMPIHLVLAGGDLLVAHAGLTADLHGRETDRVRAFALYGATDGRRDEFGLPVRLNWAANYAGRPDVIHGHVPVRRAEWVNRTIDVDTGCCFGNELTALRWPEREIVSVPARQIYAIPPRPLIEGLAGLEPY